MIWAQSKVAYCTEHYKLMWAQRGDTSDLFSIHVPSTEHEQIHKTELLISETTATTQTKSYHISWPKLKLKYMHMCQKVKWSHIMSTKKMA